MFKLRNIKIRNQLFILIGLFIFVNIIGQVLYLYQFQVNVKKRAELYAQDMICQVKNKVEMIAQDVEQLTSTIAYSSTVQEYLVADPKNRKFELSMVVSDMFKMLSSTNTNVVQILLIDSERQEISSLSSDADLHLYRGEFDEKFLQNMQGSEFSNLLYYEEKNKCFFAYLLPILSISDFAPIGEKIGYCVVFCSLERIQESLRDIYSSEEIFLGIFDAKNTAISTNSRNDLTAIEILQTLDLSSIKIDHFKETSINGYKYYIQSSLIKTTGWTVINMIPYKYLMKDIDFMKKLIVTINLILIMFISLFGLIIVKSIAVPIKDLVESINSIEVNGFESRIKTSYNNEIGILSRHFNKMLDNMADMAKKAFDNEKQIYQAEIAKKHAELSALQSQVNPHFLYNTLECIRSIAVENDIIEIESIINALASIFRYSIKGQDDVRVADELESIRNYLQIISIRFDNCYSYQINVEEATLNKRIKKMIIQPIIENAVSHGLQHKAEGGILALHISLNDNIICIKVSDNGIGIEEERLTRLKRYLKYSDENDLLDIAQKGTIGLVNIDKRIKLHYGKAYGLSIESQVNEGTTVSIQLPDISN